MTTSPPWEKLRLISVDSGNTLFGMNFDWVAQCLAERGLPVSPKDLERADFAARPEVSRLRLSGEIPPTTPGFAIYLRLMLDRIESVAYLSTQERHRLANELAPHLDGPGQKRFLWSRLLDGAEDALRLLSAHGLHLVLVSNSDGTVEEKLRQYEIHFYFDRVIDSSKVGIRKPDPSIFSLAMEGFGIFPNEAVHIGDFYHSDVLGARAAGLHAVLLDPTDDWKSWDCYTLPSLLHLARRVCGSIPQQTDR